MLLLFSLPFLSKIIAAQISILIRLYIASSTLSPHYAVVAVFYYVDHVECHNNATLCNEEAKKDNKKTSSPM